jgi:hypothetical protein
MRKILHPGPFAPDAVRFLRTRLLFEHGKQTCYGSQKSNAFDQGRSKDHVGTNVIRCFGLAGDSFYGALTDLTDTDTGTDSGEARPNGTITRLYHIQ